MRAVLRNDLYTRSDGLTSRALHMVGILVRALCLFLWSCDLIDLGLYLHITLILLKIHPNLIA